MSSPLCFHWRSGMGYLLPTYSYTVPTYLPMKLSTYYLREDRREIINVNIRSPGQAFSGVEMEEGS